MDDSDISVKINHRRLAVIELIIGLVLIVMVYFMYWLFVCINIEMRDAFGLPDIEDLKE
jgi:hypothetical protein